ncbi:MAG: tRNA (adenosine(37)-N6)-threonylcarbamoyltransferase complex transferase subunit TsaD [Chloroflexota bacterium]|nr:tRNA (adenosine(37)-N6)-threonylcarbamoyltransferase complex transferase subunit TsaD [Chloroflexota bacterium]
MKILGIETSCDETAVAIIEDGRHIVSNVVFSQSDMHSTYGGIVPELASREHMLTILPAIDQAMIDSNVTYSNLDAVAVTYGPGLAGSLLIGVNSAKGIALGRNLPLVGINHLEGHIYAAWLEDSDPEAEIGFPVICLIASGGHTDLVVMNGHGDYQLVGRTRDDAAGEAFDKGARVLGLGFPGGPAIQSISEKGDSDSEKFPRPNIKDSLDFSFSGLKTAVLRRAEQKGIYPQPDGRTVNQQDRANIASGFQSAIVEFIVRRTVQAVKKYNAKGVLLGGGVAANALLRKEIKAKCPVSVVVPRPSLCTDNGAMIGAAAYFHLRHGMRYEFNLDVVPNLRLG